MWSRRNPKAWDPTYNFRLALDLESGTDPEFLSGLSGSSTSIWSIDPITLYNTNLMSAVYCASIRRHIHQYVLEASVILYLIYIKLHIHDKEKSSLRF